MVVTEALARQCSSCGTERPFEQPPCRDGHGGDCPERACVRCGDALLTGMPPIDSWLVDDLPLDDDLPYDLAEPYEPRRASGAPWQAA